MIRFLRILALGTVVASVALAGMASGWAEDSSVFKNPNHISRAQSILESEGFLAPGNYTPGQMDRATRQAVSEYQSRHSLNESGILDDDTYQMLLTHEFAYPWDEQEAAPVRKEAARAEPVAPVTEPVPPTEVQVAQAAPVPEPEPATAQVKEEPPAPAPAEKPARQMPATASPLPLLALSGLGLMTAGLFLLLRKGA
jgi:peptidoglycan hydrolase-like protein with peptidoglycan-binding domain